MKLRPFRRLLPCILLASALHPSSSAVVVNFLEQGGNVVATGSGTINTAALNSLNAGPASSSGGEIAPPGLLVLSAASSSFGLWGGISGPDSFGVITADSVSNSASGDVIGVAAKNKFLYLPASYVSGAALQAAATWTNTTFATLGLTPGTYVWKWGIGATADSFTLNVGPVVPAPNPASPAIDVGKKGNANERFTATGGSFLLTGTGVDVNQIQWNFLKGVTRKVSVSGTKWSVKISPLKTGVNTIQISGSNTATKKSSKPIDVIITRK